MNKDDVNNRGSKMAAIVMIALFVEALFFIAFAIYDAGAEERDKALEKRIMDETIQSIKSYDSSPSRKYKNTTRSTNTTEQKRTATPTKATGKRTFLLSIYK